MELIKAHVFRDGSATKVQRLNEIEIFGILSLSVFNLKLDLVLIEIFIIL